MMDEVEEEVEKAKKEWDEAYVKLVEQIKAIEGYGKSNSTESEEKRKDSLPRMNGVAQDCLALLNSLQFKLDLLSPQLPTDEQVQSAKSLLESWTNRSQRYAFSECACVWLLRKWREKCLEVWNELKDWRVAELNYRILKRLKFENWKI